MAKKAPQKPEKTGRLTDDELRKLAREIFARKRLKLSGGAEDVLVDQLGGEQLDSVARISLQLAAIATVLYPKNIVSGDSIKPWEMEAARSALIAAKGTEQSLFGCYSVPGIAPWAAAAMRADPYRELQVQLYGVKARLDQIEVLPHGLPIHKSNEIEAREKISECLGDALCKIADLLHDRMQILADVGGEQSDPPV